MTLIPTILCGGAGSRLWPVSRELHPKPFIRLADGQSLLHKAFLRGATLPGAREVLTITNRKVSRWRDYLDPLAVFDAVGWPKH